MSRIITTKTPDGPEHVTVCDEHQWASLPAYDADPPRRCEVCDAHTEGFARYAAVTRAERRTRPTSV